VKKVIRAKIKQSRRYSSRYRAAGKEMYRPTQTSVSHSLWHSPHNSSREFRHIRVGKSRNANIADVLK
jgi:hypothetical protein